MSEFDDRARDWDKNQRYIDRSEAVAKAFLEMIPLHPGMKALGVNTLTISNATLSLRSSKMDVFSNTDFIDHRHNSIDLLLSESQKC